jgi:type I restriction enzyme S subunit
MSRDWPSVSLKRILTLERRPVKVAANAEYAEIGIYSFGRGIFHKPPRTGFEVGDKSLYLIKDGDLIFQITFAWEGAVGLASMAEDGMYGSTRFPTFRVDERTCYPPYLLNYFRTEVGRSQLAAISPGSAGRNRVLSLKRLPEVAVPLPPLDEQRRLVARIEELAAKVEQAQALRQQAVEAVEALVAAYEKRVWPDECLENALALEDVTVLLQRGRHSKQGESNHYLIKTRHVQMGQYVETDVTLAPYLVETVKPEALVQYGDILIACSAAGCLGRVAKYDSHGKRASTDTHVAIARAKDDVILPEYLYYYLKGAQGQHQLRSRERGDWQREKVGFRLTELNLRDLKQVPVPIPSLSDQRRIVAYLDGLQAKVEAVKRHQAATAAKLDALLPSILDKAFKGEL